MFQAHDPALRRHERLWTVGLLAFTAAVLVADLYGGREYWIGILFLLVPAGAAFELGPERTALLGTLAVGLLVWRYGLTGPWGFAADAWITIGTVATAAVGCVVASAVRRQRWRQLTESRFTVQVLQQTLLHDLPVFADEVEVYGFYRAAATEANVGGDLFEVVPSAYGTRILIADVQGKGLGAVQLGAAVVWAFREAAYYQPDPLVVIGRLEQAVARYRARVKAREDLQDERFVTALVVDFGADGRVRLIHCGHPDPLAVSDTGVRRLSRLESGLPLGLRELAGGERTVQELGLLPGERLLLFTDGVIEARNTDGTFYPLAERLRPWTALAPQELVERLQCDLAAYSCRPGTEDDQAALLVCPRTG